MRSNDMFREIETISREVASRLKDYFEKLDIEVQSPVQSQASMYRPVIDITEDAKNLYVRAELPGVKKEEINLTMRGDTKLEISGMKSAPPGGETLNSIKKERKFGRFSRLIELPEHTPVDGGNITASYTDGVLVVTLPKEAQAAGSTINIQ